MLKLILSVSLILSFISLTSHAQSTGKEVITTFNSLPSSVDYNQIAGKWSEITEITLNGSTAPSGWTREIIFTLKGSADLVTFQTDPYSGKQTLLSVVNHGSTIEYEMKSQLKNPESFDLGEAYACRGSGTLTKPSKSTSLQLIVLEEYGNTLFDTHTCKYEPLRDVLICKEHRRIRAYGEYDFGYEVFKRASTK